MSSRYLAIGKTKVVVIFRKKCLHPKGYKTCYWAILSLLKERNGAYYKDIKLSSQRRALFMTLSQGS